MQLRFGGGDGEEGVEDVVLLEFGRAFEVEDLLEVGEGGVADDEGVVEDETLRWILQACGQTGMENERFSDVPQVLR